MTPEQRRRLEAVLPFYVNGSADERDRAFVESLLDNPSVVAMLRWHEGLAEKVQAQVHAVGDDMGLAALMAKVHAQKPPATVRRPAPWWARWVSPQRWSLQALQVPALAVLSLVVVGQAVLLHRHSDGLAADGEHGAIRGVVEPTAEQNSKGAVLKVNFKDDVSEHDLRLLLIATGANIIQGPGQLGDYLVSVPPSRADAALQELRTSKWVNSADLLKPLASKP